MSSAKVTQLSPESIVRVNPAKIRYKLAAAGDGISVEQRQALSRIAGLLGGDWDRDRVLLEKTSKHRSIVQHFVDGVPWENTDLFKNQYAVRFARGETVRGAKTIAELAESYRDRMDGMFKDLKERGFRVASTVLPHVHIGHDGVMILGNDGNHRIAMCKIIGITKISVAIKTVHADYVPPTI